MRGGVIALGVAAAVRRDAGRHAAKREGAIQRTYRRRTTVEFLHVLHVDTPAFADDLSAIGDLSARLGVERRLAQQHGDATVTQPTESGDLCLDLDDVVPDERAGGTALARRQFPLCR